MPLAVEMQGGLTTLELHNPCLKITSCTILLPTRSFPWVPKDKERKDGWGRGALGVHVLPAMLGAWQHSWEHIDPKVVFMLP